MREILFRGKRVDNGEWVSGHYCFNPFFNRAEIFSFDDVHSYVYEVRTETVGQLTEIKDKNGKKVFEGDIIALNTYSSIEPINDYEGEVLIGIYGIGLLGRDGTGTENCFWIRDVEDYINHYEIFGNKFDNPEMLNGINGDDISHLDHVCTGEPPF